MSNLTITLLLEEALNRMHFQPSLLDPHKTSYQEQSPRIIQTVIIGSKNESLTTIKMFFEFMASYWNLVSSFEVVSPPSVFALAHAAFERVGFGSDGPSLVYPEELAFFGNPFNGVEVSVVNSIVQLALHAWERLVLRFLKTAVQSAELSHHDIRIHAQWPTFLQHIQAIEQRIIAEENNSPPREATPKNV